MKKNDDQIKKTLSTWNMEYKKGFTSYVILVLLSKKSMYGYEIVNKLNELTDNKITFQESAVYHILKKLKANQFVTSNKMQSSVGPTRIYYKTTETGKLLIESFTTNCIFPINKALKKVLNLYDFTKTKEANLKNKLPQLKIGDLIIEKPIIQGGMGVGISLSKLVSAVSNEGGIGVLSTVGIGNTDPGFKKDYRKANKKILIKEIRTIRKLTKGVFGLNIMLALSDFDELVEIAINESVDILFVGAGLPLKIPNNLSLKKLKKSKTKLIPIVSSGRAVKIIFNTWAKNFNCIPDGVVLEGPMAGGHLGFKLDQIHNPDYKLEKLLLDVIQVVEYFKIKFKKDIPIIVGGGIFSGKDIHKFIQLGANGVQLGTRFVATEECDASDEFKNQYIKCKKQDIKIIESPVGLLGRAINNTFLEDVKNNLKTPFSCPWKCLKTCDYKTAPYCIANALLCAKNGNFKNGFAFAGANAHKISEIITVKKLMTELEIEYNNQMCINQN